MTSPAAKVPRSGSLSIGRRWRDPGSSCRKMMRRWWHRFVAASMGCLLPWSLPRPGSASSPPANCWKDSTIGSRCWWEAPVIGCRASKPWLRPLTGHINSSPMRSSCSSVNCRFSQGGSPSMRPRLSVPGTVSPRIGSLTWSLASSPRRCWSPTQAEPVAASSVGDDA